MAVRFMQLPQIGEGVSSLLNFAPLAAGLQNYNQANEAAQQQQNMTQIGETYANQGAGAAAKQAAGMGEVDAGMQFSREAKTDKDRQIKMLGGVAQAAKFEKDPARRALIWQTGLKRAGVNPADLDPDELDPMTGPDVFLAASGMAQDPRESQLMDLKIAQAQKSLAAPVGGATNKPANVQEWEYFQTLSPEQQLRYNAMKRGEQWKNTGTAYVNPGDPSQSIPIDVAGKASQTAIGTAQGGATADLPKIIQTSSQILGQLASLEADPDLDSMVGPVSGRLPNVSAGAERVQSKIDQTTGAAFLTAFETLKGGGQITEIEGRKATDAITRLQNVRMSPTDYRAAIAELKAIVQNGVIRAEVQAGRRSESDLKKLQTFDNTQVQTAPQPQGRGNGRVRYIGPAS